MPRIEALTSYSVMCEGVVSKRIAPLGNPAQASVTVYKDGSRDVGCDRLDIDMGLCGVAKTLNLTEASRCIQLFPVSSSINPEGIIHYDRHIAPREQLRIGCQTQDGDLVVKVLGRSVERSPYFEEGKGPVHLNPSEFTILEALIKNRGKVLSTRALTEILYFAMGDPASELPSTNNIAVLIYQLRRKIGDNNKQLIQHDRGEGYSIP